ncbi:hypothetical protein GCM10010523_00310 [Paenarthrobacter ilicis]
MDDAVEDCSFGRLLKDNRAQLGPVQLPIGLQNTAAKGLHDALQPRSPGLNYLPRKDVGVHKERAQLLEPRCSQ